MARPKKVPATPDALTIMDRLFYEGKPKQQALLDQERANADIARRIYELRTQAGLSQRELAERVGTTASVICRLEDADYQGHSLAMLHRIAAAWINESKSGLFKSRRSRTCASNRTGNPNSDCRRAISIPVPHCRCEQSISP